MPLQDHMNLVSVDDHLIEPPHVWSDRLPSKYVERGPQLVEAKGDQPLRDHVFHAIIQPGSQAWRYEDRYYPQIGLNAVAGKPREQYGLDPLRYDDMIPGCYDPVERVKDMDLDGVDVAMPFPSLPRFAGTLFLEGEDKELARLCISAWNDFLLDEWCAVAPERFIPLALLPLWDVAASVAEIERVAAKGARAISFPENMVGLGLPSFHTDHWDRVFAAAVAADMPLCMHFGTSGKVPNTAPDAPHAVMIALMGCNSMFAMADLLFSPVFHKHPELKVALSEGGVGWIPYLLERSDATWERHRFYQNINQELRPSEIFRRNIWGCFITDQNGVDNRAAIGLDKMMWECDYPHSDSNWPNSRKIAAEQFVHVPDDEVHQIVELNARTLFRFPRAG
jgi:predicted TIM-barrel fold metal-dependent hydrolase